MKNIELNFGTNLKWVRNYANKYKGTIVGNQIIASKKFLSGDIFFLNCAEGIDALYYNVKYNIDISITENNHNDDFIGLYYNLTDHGRDINIQNLISQVGLWRFNLIIKDSKLTAKYNLLKDSTSHVLFIFINKKIFSNFFNKENSIFVPNDELHKTKKPLLQFHRADYKSINLIKDLKNFEIQDINFKLNFLSAVNILLSNYLQETKDNIKYIQSLNNNDLLHIIDSTKYILENITEPFPSINKLAKAANMSESKYKTIFKKVIKTTPNQFYLANKLLIAKELLENKSYNISEVSSHLNFPTTSYFSLKFKEHFGISPTIYQKNN